MKYSSSLKFNAVSEWWDDYIAYDTLKKYIYQLEKQQHGQGQLPDIDLESNEQASLLGRTGGSNTDGIFVPLLDRELLKIVMFYEHQEKEILEEVDDLGEQVAQTEQEGLDGDRYRDEPDDDDDDDDDESLSRSPTRRRKLSGAGQHRQSASHPGQGTSRGVSNDRRASLSSFDGLEESLVSSNSPKSPKGTMTRIANKLNIMKDSFTSTIPDNVWSSKTDYAYDIRLLYKRRITRLYISVSNLKSYVEVNYSGFRKILKKYDKVTYSELKDHYLHDVVETAPPFTQTSKDRLNAALTVLLDLYAKCVTRGDKTAAKLQLQLHQRENIAWERDTVWRQMIGAERRGDEDGLMKTMPAKEEKAAVVDIPTSCGRLRVTRRKFYMLASILLFIGLLNVQMIEGREANRCLAILVFCSVMWASEAVPLFVTSMSVPLLLVMLQVIRDPNGEGPLPTPDATKYVFSIMFSPTIMLLIGGFTIASALSKTNIDRVLITRVLSLAGTRPSTVLLVFMGVSCFASMWISNVAAPTLCFTLIRPILRTLPKNSAFGPCLILAIALAANIGGQSSPISSPQNLIALDAMYPRLDWASWFAVAIPVSAISILLIWLLLLVSYRPARSPDGEGEIEIRAIRPTREPFTLKQYWVSFVCVVTIGLWCVERSIHPWVGDMGVVAIIPILAFFSTGVLKKDDFEQFAWTIVFLAMGGIALGKGVMSSGLLKVMDVLIHDLVSGYSLIQVVWILSPIVLVISTFISHTIASVLLVPIASEVGKSLPGDHHNLLIFITGLICSTGMGMPVSGFPNQTAATQEDEMGELYLQNTDFLKNGIPASIIATVVVSTVGYLLMKAIGL